MSNNHQSAKHNPVLHAVGSFLEMLSGEYLLINFRFPNGGTVVFLRAAHVTLILFFGAIAAINWLDPNRGCNFSWYELRLQTIQHVPWMGAIFVTVYALLYARFASQWTYLAGVYNQIKAAQVRTEIVPDVLAEWKAGFIEDADDLHLLRKPMFASIANVWLKEGEGASPVKINLEKHMPGGKHRCERIEADATNVVILVNARYA
jgi:hypothetical protein